MPFENRGRKRAQKQAVISQPATPPQFKTIPPVNNKLPESNSGRPYLHQLRIPKPALPNGSKTTIEPTHIPNLNDPSRPIRVYGTRNGKGTWTDVEVILVTDLRESWISESCLHRLHLTVMEDSVVSGEYGHLGTKTVTFAGKVNLIWTEKNCHKSRDTVCQVVRNGQFDIFLRHDLVSPATKSSQPKPRDDSFQTSIISDPSVETPILTDDCSKVGSFDGIEGIDGEFKDNSSQARGADKWISQMKTTHKFLVKDSKQVHDTPVKIAVLDTGVDSKHPFIWGAMSQRRIVKCKSFVENDESAEDVFGHGTHVASLLLRVAPDAQLYIAKIANSEEIPSNHKIAQAIEWATNLEVNIITMSFGLEKNHPEMHRSIKKAYSSNIILFAAASNNGGNHEVTYPAKYDEVNCVFATDDMGTALHCNPTKMEKAGWHFATLGQAVKSAWPVMLQEGGGSERRKTGTSFAAPIAAGVAACMLEFALMNDMDEELYKILRQHQGMRCILAKQLSEKRGELHYIHPWKLWNEDRTTNDILTIVKDDLKKA